MIEPTSIATAAAWGAYIAWKELLPLVRRSGANGNGIAANGASGNANGAAASSAANNGNGAAGAKSVDFWRLELREQMQTALDRTLTPKFDAQIALLADVKNAAAEVSKGITELVTLHRTRT